MPRVNDFLTRILGDTKPITHVIRGANGPIDLTGQTVKVVLRDDDGEVVAEETDDGVEVQPASEFEPRLLTADESGECPAPTLPLSSEDHGLRTGDRVQLSTDGELPTALQGLNWPYVIVSGQDEFRLTSTPGGKPIDFSGLGEGDHSYQVRGQVLCDFPEAITDEGRFHLWFVVIDGDVRESFPPTKSGITIDVVRSGNW